MTTTPMTTIHRELMGILLLSCPGLGRRSRRGFVAAAWQAPPFRDRAAGCRHPRDSRRGDHAIDGGVGRAEPEAGPGVATVDDDGRVTADPVAQRCNE